MGIKTQINKHLFEPLGYRFINLARLKGEYNEDGLNTNHNCDFMKDPRFINAYRRGFEACEEDPHMRYGSWRVHVALWIASNAAKLKGDFVECGVNRGFLSSAIMEYLDWNSLNKKFFLFDTFCGLDEALINNEEKGLGRLEQSKAYYSECYQKAVENFKEFKNVVIVRGSVPETLKGQDIPLISYLSIDMNCTAPEIAAVNYFWDKITPGGMILLDDYAYSGFLPQKAAFDRFALEKGIDILSLPTGQGLIIKS